MTMPDYPQNADQAAYVFDIEAVILSRRVEHNDATCWCTPDIEHVTGEPDLIIHREPGGTEH